MTKALFPWTDAMRFGLGGLGLSSSEFWGLTPRELALALEGRTGRVRGARLSRAEFDSLLKAFPDGVSNG